MNTLLLEHFAAVSKIAAYRQSRERQQGVNCSEGYLISTDAGLRFGGPRTFEIFFRYEFVDQSQYIGGFQSPTISVVVPYNERERDLIYMYCGATYVWLPITSGNYYHTVVSYNGSESVCYLNGVEVGRKPFEGDVASLQFRIGAQSQPPKGPIYLCRHYDYALSAAEVAALYNNGDPAGYVLPGYAHKMDKSVELGPVTSWTLRGNITFDSAAEEFHMVSDGALTSIIPVDISNVRLIRTDCIYQIRFKIKGSGIIAVLDGSHPRPEYPFINITATDEYVQHTVLASFADPNTVVFKRQSACDVYIKDISISIVGCIAEYLPQNLVVAHKRDFPQVVFPNGRYTPSKGTYTFNNSTTTTALWDQPQANGFSGPFMRFEAITAVSIYNDYWSTYLKGVVPVVVTAEYRSTKPLYHRTGISSKYIFIADANEGDAKIITIMVPDYTGSSRLSFADVPVTADDWLELRILSIEVDESAVLSWLDSAKQLPLNDEYLPPLLETAGGYDLTANGTPEIVYKSE